MKYAVEWQLTDKCAVTGEGETHADVIKNLTGLYEVFSIAMCGACRSKNIRPTYRHNEDAKLDFYEFKCYNPDCKATLSLGQSKDKGSLYPRRKYHKQHPDVKSKKAKEGDFLPNGGWELYVNPEGKPST